jgi:hypothetical protein
VRVAAYADTANFWQYICSLFPGVHAMYMPIGTLLALMRFTIALQALLTDFVIGLG